VGHRIEKESYSLKFQSDLRSHGRTEPAIYRLHCNKICTNVNIKFTLTYLFLEKIYITFFNGSQDLTILI